MLKCRLSPSKTPLLDSRGGLWRVAEGDETEAGVVDFLNLIPPPHLACPGGDSCDFSFYNTFVSTHKYVIPFFLGSPYKPFRMTGVFFPSPSPSSSREGEGKLN
jgi:hypothetical protein